MSSIDEIRRKKLEEMQKDAASRERKEEDIAKLEEEVIAIENIVKQKFTKDALSRYGNLKSAHPKRALQLITVLAQIISSGGLQAEITDNQLRSLLSKLSPNREFRITRK